MADVDWIPVADRLPPEGETVQAVIDDRAGRRNETRLKRSGSLWFFPDMSTYVDYSPTHWRPVADQERLR